jgi:hypothetical protein
MLFRINDVATPVLSSLKPASGVLAEAAHGAGQLSPDAELAGPGCNQKSSRAVIEASESEVQAS